MALNHYFNQRAKNEQNLYEDIIIEGLKIYGQDIYYLPRSIVNKDLILGEDMLSRFRTAHMIEMYMETTEGFAGEQEIVNKFDHATVFNKNTPHIELAKELEERGHNVILVNYQPTSENMVIDFAEKIKNRLPKNIQLHSLKLQETDTSFAEWYASDNE